MQCLSQHGSRPEVAAVVALNLVEEEAHDLVETDRRIVIGNKFELNNTNNNFSGTS